MSDDQPRRGGLSALMRNWAVIGPLVGATVGGLFVALVFEGPRLFFDATHGYQEREAELKKKQADADLARAKADAANLPALNALGGASEGMPPGANRSATGLRPLVERPPHRNP